MISVIISWGVSTHSTWRPVMMVMPALWAIFAVVEFVPEARISAVVMAIRALSMVAIQTSDVGPFHWIRPAMIRTSAQQEIGVSRGFVSLECPLPVTMGMYVRRISARPRQENAIMFCWDRPAMMMTFVRSMTPVPRASAPVFRQIAPT